jgi:hypothetical protein
MVKKVRILVGAQFEGRVYEPNAVVEFDDKLAKSFEKEGLVDSTVEAVAYCLDSGASVIKHTSAAKEDARIDTAEIVADDADKKAE